MNKQPPQINRDQYHKLLSWLRSVRGMSERDAARWIAQHNPRFPKAKK